MQHAPNAPISPSPYRMKHFPLLLLLHLHHFLSPTIAISISPQDPPDPVQPAIDFADPAVAIINNTYYSFGNDLARFAVGKPPDVLENWSTPWPYLGGVSPAWAQPGSSGGAPPHRPAATSSVSPDAKGMRL